MIGNKYCQGKKHSQETKIKMRKIALNQDRTYIGKRIQKQVQCIESGIVYESAQAATEALGKKAKIRINASAKAFERGVFQKVYGVHWAYVKNSSPLNEEER